MLGPLYYQLKHFDYQSKQCHFLSLPANYSSPNCQPSTMHHDFHTNEQRGTSPFSSDNQQTPVYTSDVSAISPASQKNPNNSGRNESRELETEGKGEYLLSPPIHNKHRNTHKRDNSPTLTPPRNNHPNHKIEKVIRKT